MEKKKKETIFGDFLERSLEEEELPWELEVYNHYFYELLSSLVFDFLISSLLFTLY